MQESLAEINAKSDGQFNSKVRYNLLQLFLIETDITVTGNPEPFPSPAYKVIVGFPIRLLFLILSSLPEEAALLQKLIPFHTDRCLLFHR